MTSQYRHFWLFPGLTIVGFPRRAPHGFKWLVVYSFILESFHTECVGEETFSKSKKEVDGKYQVQIIIKINSKLNEKNHNYNSKLHEKNREKNSPEDLY